MGGIGRTRLASKDLSENYYRGKEDKERRIMRPIMQQKVNKFLCIMMTVIMVVTLVPLQAFGQEGIPADQMTERAIDNRISGLIWLDENGDGIRDAEEVPLAGFSVNLVQGDDGTIVSQASTDQGGTYSFTDLEPGRYGVSVGETEQASFPSNLSAEGMTKTITLESTSKVNNIDIGMLAKITQEEKPEELVEEPEELGKEPVSKVEAGEGTETAEFEGSLADEAAETEGSISEDEDALSEEEGALPPLEDLSVSKDPYPDMDGLPTLDDLAAQADVLSDDYQTMGGVVPGTVGATLGAGFNSQTGLRWKIQGISKAATSVTLQTVVYTDGNMVLAGFSGEAKAYINQNPNGYNKQSDKSVSCSFSYLSVWAGLPTDPTPYNFTFTGLSPNTTYYVHLFIQGPGPSFSCFEIKTAPAAPTATTNAATNIAATTATLNGTYNTQNAPGNVSYQYGTTTGFGLTASYNTSTTVGANTHASKAISGLAPNTTYYYRIVVVTAGGTAYGPTLNFRTVRNITVSYQGNGGSVSAASGTYAATATFQNLPTATRSGYSFAGWYTAASGGTKAATTTVVGSLFGGTTGTLYARWTQNNHTITFNAQNGTPTPANITRATTAALGTLPTVKRAGYTFAGWFTSPSGGAQASATSTPIGLKSALGATSNTITLYARWTQNTNTVAFDPQGGSPTPSSKTISATTMLGTLDTPTKSGYNFSGWYTAPTGGTKASATSSPAALDPLLTNGATLTLYAQWTAASYNIQVKYETRAGDPVAGKTDFVAQAAYASTYAPTVAQIKATKYVLIDWRLDGVAQGNTMPSITVPLNGATITLVYGQDKGGGGTNGTEPDDIEDITITKEYQCAATSIRSTEEAYVNVGTSFTDVAPAITGYTYHHYEIGSVSSATHAIPNIPVSVGDVDFTITYDYTINSHTVTVKHEDRQGNTLRPSNSFNKEFGTTVTAVPLDIPSYTIVGWMVDGGSLQPGIAPAGITMSDANMVLTLVYGQDRNDNMIEDITVTMKYYTGAAQIAADGEVHVDVGTSFIEAAIAVSGYTYHHFVKDGISSAAGAVPNIAIAAGDANFEVTYQYDAKPYVVKVEYKLRDGSSVPGATNYQVSQIYNTEFVPTQPSLTGYKLVGWEQDGVPMTGSPSILIPAQETTLILIYGYDSNDNGVEDIQVTKEYISGGGTTLRPSEAVTVDVGTAFADTAPPIIGYTYSQFKVGGGAAQSGQPSILVNVGDSAFTVSYIYTANGYTVDVKYVYRDGSPLDGGIHDFGTAAPFASIYAPTTAELAKSGYTLIDWEHNGVLQGNTTPSFSMPAANVALTLVYGQDKADGNGDPNPDGVEDFAITVRHETQLGGILLPVSEVYVNKGTAYIGGPDAGLTTALMGYAYIDCVWDGVSVGTPNPHTVSNITDEHVVVYRYTPNDYPITVTYEYKDGSSLSGSQNAQITHGFDFTTSSTPALNVPSFTSLILIDWTLDGVSQGNANPGLISVMRAHNIVLIYGDDADGDNTEDVRFTKKYEIVGSGTLQSDEVVDVDVGMTFNDAHAPISGYDYAGFSVDGGTMVAAPAEPSIPVSSGDLDKTIIYFYTIASFVIDVTYELRDGTPLPGTHDYQTTEIFNSTYVPTIANEWGYVMVDWKLDGVSQGNDMPSITVPSRNCALTLVYGYDHNDNGDEDIIITKKYESISGANLAPSATVVVDVGTTFADASIPLSGYSYQKYRIDGGSAVSGEPSIPLVAGDKAFSITYLYTPNGYTIDVVYELRDGSSLEGGLHDFQVVKPYLSVYAPPASQLEISGFVLVDWQLGGAAQGNTAPSLTVPASNETVTLIYGYDSDDDDIEDITFTKKYETAGGVTIRPADSAVVNVGSTFDDVHQNISGYSYDGYKVGGGTLNANMEPAITVSVGDVAQTIIYIYHPKTYSINVKYEMRDGSAVSGATDFTTSGVFLTTYAPTMTQLMVSGYLLVDWKLDGVYQGSVTPSISVPAAHCTITLIYGYDRNINFSEDIQITKKYKGRDNTTLQADDTVLLDLGDVFSDGETAFTGYTYEGYQIENTALNASPNTPHISISAGMYDFAVTYWYTLSKYRAQVSYETRSGESISGATPFMTTCAYNSTYAPTATQLAVRGYVLLDWKLNGVSQGNTSPLLTVPATNFSIALVYGQDSDRDGIEDITITKKYLDAAGKSLKAAEKKIVNVGSTFADAAPAIVGHIYSGYKIGTSVKTTGTPSIMIAAGDRDAEVSYFYTINTYKVKVKVVDGSGSSLMGGTHDKIDSKTHGQSYAVTSPKIAGYEYQHWVLNGNKKSGAPSIASLESDTNITMVYAEKAQEDVTDSDRGNYKFVKVPNIKNVAAGETVDYTFTGFGNSWPVELEEYGIADVPDKGLDFISAQLPAFTKGAGVTYDVVYRTNYQGTTTLHSRVPADQAFSFSAPVLSSGEYLTSIAFRFGTVPAGFAVGDSMNMTFKVWDNPPSETLTNIGILSYKVDGEYREFVTGNASGTITIGGYFGFAKTGDSARTTLGLTFAVVALGCGLVSTSMLRRRKPRVRR